MEFSNVTTIENARELLKEKFSKIKRRKETIKVTDSLNRIIAENYYAKEDLPTFNRSTVDGYAVKQADTLGKTNLNIVGTVHMGKPYEEILKNNEAIYVPTGGMVPDGADGVIMIEDTEVLWENQLKIFKPITEKENMIFIGEDLKKDELVITAGEKITPLNIGILSVAGITKIRVYKPFTFAIISTGDEIIKTHQAQNKGEIRDINSHILEGLVKESGCQVTKKIIVCDDYDKIKRTVEKALDASDAVIMTGGSSVGNLDYTYDVLNSISNSKVFIHGLHVKPGKPTIISKTRNKPVFALPGHPVSAVIIYKLLVDYFLDIITGSSLCESRYVTAKIGSDIKAIPGKMTCQVVRLGFKDNIFTANPVYGKSGVISLLSKSHGYVKIDINKTIEKDENVVVHLL